MATATANSPTDGPPGPKVAARPVDVSYQIELLGHPDQRADIPNCLRPYRPRGTQIRDRRRCCRAKHDLARNGTATDRVPHRLGCDTVAAAIHVPFEHMHIFHVAQFRPERKRRTIILWHWSLARCPSVVQECEGRARLVLLPKSNHGLNRDCASRR